MSTLIYTHTDCLEHRPGPGHPESPARLEAVVDAADQDEDADFLTSLTKAMVETWAITDASELERVQRVAALEDLDDALEDLPRADRVRLAAMARTFKSRARPVAAA